MRLKSNRQKYLLVTLLAVVIAVGTIGISLLSFKPQTVATDASLGARRNEMGNAGARLELVEYGDYL